MTSKRLTGTEVVRRLRRIGCIEKRGRGSHKRFESPDGHCKTTVPVHRGETLGIGLMNAIEKDMEHCLGKGWLG